MIRPPHHVSLAGLRWNVRGIGDLSHVPAEVRGRVFAATVPGCIHTDLIDAGVIRDPRVGDAEEACQWVSWTDWRYETAFEVDERLLGHDEIDLAFDHLDTIALIEVNGLEVGRAQSEFLPWRFSVRDAVRPGRNELAVTFTSPLRYVQEEAARLGARPVNGAYPAYNMIRKCASNFEWDWGPRVATCGIAGEARLEGWSCVRIDRVTARVVEHKWWMIDADIHLAWSRRLSQAVVDVRMQLEDAVDCAAVELVADRSAEHQPALSLALREPVFWKPTGHGAQHLYRLRVSVLTRPTPASQYDAVSSRVLDVHRITIGAREVGLACWYDYEADAFPLVFNSSQDVYCRGANWIPEGLFPRDRTPERVRERLQQLKDANMNMVRVWGGGRYEPDWFYDICDELGIMVWQDFMFACACYPEEEPHRSLVEQEARHHVARLARHPSVVLWCGGNECTWAHESWGFKEKLAPGQTWGEKFYDELLPRICSEVNPSIPYIPNSPFSPTAGVHPNDPSQGDTHTWDVWGDGYRTVTPRFCSEFGQQAPSNRQTLDAAGLAAFPAPGDVIPPLLAARQRGPGGNKRWYDDPIAAWFRPPRDFDEWHYLAQLLQARSLRIGIEWHRANMGRGGCMGSLVWQLNDAWPGLSWSLIDAAGQPKLAYHAVTAAFEDRLLTIAPFDNEPCVVAVNDTDEKWSGRLGLRRMGFDGVLNVEPEQAPFVVPPRSVQRLCRVVDVVGVPDDPRRELVVAECAGHRALWFYLPDRELHYPPPQVHAEAVHHYGRKAALTISSPVLLRDVVIDIERVLPGAMMHRQPPFTLLPGKPLHLGIRLGGKSPILPPDAAERLTSRPVFWCANDFGAQ